MYITGNVTHAEAALNTISMITEDQLCYMTRVPKVLISPKSFISIFTLSDGFIR